MAESLPERYVARQRVRKRHWFELCPVIESGPPCPFGREVRRSRNPRRKAMFGVLGVLAALFAQRASAATLHTVQPGETLSHIAAHYGSTVAELARVNGIVNPDRILAGMTLTIPSGVVISERVHRVKAGETLTAIARQYGVSVEALAQVNQLENAHYIQVGQFLLIPGIQDEHRYRVQPGDTLSRIVSRFGVDLSELVRLNNLPNPDYLVVGQELLIPKEQAAVILSGLPVWKQSLPLSCEAAAVSMVTAYWGQLVEESVLIEHLPRHPNPHRGFRGNVNGVFGGIDDYGVYAEPFVAILEQSGFQAEAVYAQGDENVLKAELRAGRPVVVWMTNLASVQPRLHGEVAGEEFVLVPQEHAVVVYGFDDTLVYVADPGDGQFRSFTWPDFLRSWGYFDGMMLRIWPAG